MDMKKKAYGIIAVLLALAPAVACAEQGQQPAPIGSPVATAPAAGKSITLQHYQQRHGKKMMAADTDGDGRISKTEFLATGKSGKGNPEKRFAKMDLNSDGFLDKSEVDAFLAKRFKRQDANGDGVLDAQEQSKGQGAKGQKSGVDGE